MRLLKVITHDDPQFRNHNHEEHNGGSNLHRKDLPIKLNQPDSSGLIKALPRIKRTYSTSTTNNLRHDLASEGTVEGDDGLVFFGQHGSLHALERHVGGYDDKDDGSDTEEANEEHLERGDLADGLRVAAIRRGILPCLGYSHEKGSWDIDCSLFRNSVDGGGDDDIFPGLDGWDTLVPALLARVGDDDVSPCHLDAAEYDNRDDGDEGADNGDVCHEGVEDVYDEAVGGVVDDGDVEAAKACEAATDGLEMADCGAHGACDRLLLDQEEICLHRAHLALSLVVKKRSVNLIGVKLEGCGGG